MKAAEPRRDASWSDRGQVRQELALHLATLSDLGPDYADEVAEAFLSRIDDLIDERIDARLAARRAAGAAGAGDHQRIAMLLIAIPLTAIAGGIAGLTGIALVWLALVLIAWRR